MSSEMMVGDREAAGAIAGMVETYGRNLPGEGEWVSGVCCGKKFSGSVLSVQEGWVMVELDGGWIAVRPSDIHEPLPGIPMDALAVDPNALD